MTPFRQSLGIISVCQIVENRVWRNKSIAEPPYFSSSELKPQIPAALLFLSLFTAYPISEGLKGSSEEHLFQIFDCKVSWTIIREHRWVSTEERQC